MKKESTDYGLRLNLVSWVELRFAHDDIFKNLTIGNFLTASTVPLDNRKFLNNFSFGLRYVNQAFAEPVFRIALEDFARAIDSEWDESIYHFQHCLECIRDYFGDGERGWSAMRKNLVLDETELREVTDFSGKSIRHGATRAPLETLADTDKINKASRSMQICQKAITFFGEYLDEHDIYFSKIKRTVYKASSALI